MAEPTVSIVIVSWNTRDILLDCLQSIEDETSVSHEVIVVDNASHDGTVEAVRSAFPSTKLIANEDNRGFAAANNQGAEIATGEFLLLLNPDTVVLDHAIDRCVERMRTWREERIGILGCQVWETPEVLQRTSLAFPGPQSIIKGYFRLDTLLPFLPLIKDTEYSRWDRKSDRDVQVITGVFMFMPRELIEEDGLFDEQFFVYGEEADLCYRIWQRGLACRFWTGARIIHLDGGAKSTAQIRPTMHVQLLDSNLRFIRKNRGRIAWVVSWIALVAAMAPRAAYAGLLATFRRREDDRKTLAVWGGTLRWLLGGRRP